MPPERHVKAGAADPVYAVNDTLPLPSGAAEQATLAEILNEILDKLKVTQVDGNGNSLVIAGANTGEKGIRVFGGPTDPISDVPVHTEFGHHQIHEGESYSWCSLQTAGLASGSNFDVRISVPALAATTRTPHMIFEIVASGECEVYLHKGVTWTSAGTAVAAGATATARDNRNHNSSNVAGTALYISGATALTVNSTGTLKYIWYLVSTGQKTATGDRSLNEIDLAASTEYMLRITSRATGLKFLVRLDWYEDLGV